ncbi:MAG: N-acetylmuramoyl-L-alanine amidase [Marinilabiliaceae bacterium]|nr:N-acetylmuramoyl-L-alanine amidase [Marinilabiliaceae bacterium]
MLFRKAILSLISILFFSTHLLSQNNNQTTKPLSGEGIYALLLRNGLDPQKYYNEFITLNNTKLGKNNSLFSHHNYILPLKNDILTEPLWGTKRKEYKIESHELDGALIFLISGHGGPDPGASGKYGNHTLNEDEYAYDITLRLGKRLREMGATVHFIILDENDGIRDDQFLEYDNDETCMGESIPLDQVERLRQRVRKVNDISKKNKSIKYQRSISLHLDSRSNNKQIDVFFYYHHTSKKGKQMAETLQQKLSVKYDKHQPSRGFNGTVEERSLYELKYTRPVSVFIELGNIKNYRDQQRFIIADNRQALANWLSEGIVNDFRNSLEK